MRARKYIQVLDHQFVKLERIFKTACCDCDLVHLWQLTKKKGVFGFVITLDNRATAQRRRHRKCKE